MCACGSRLKAMSLADPLVWLFVPKIHIVLFAISNAHCPPAGSSCVKPRLLVPVLYVVEARPDRGNGGAPVTLELSVLEIPVVGSR